MDMLRFFQALMTTLRRGWEWLVLHATGRDLAGERAQRMEAERQAAVGEEERLEAEARHAELVEATVAQTTESRRLCEALERQSRADTSRSMSRRRDEIASRSRSHDVEIRSSTWSTDADEDVVDAVAALMRAV